MAVKSVDREQWGLGWDWLQVQGPQVGAGTTCSCPWLPTVGCGPCPQAESTLTRSWLAAQSPASAPESRGADATSSGRSALRAGPAQPPRSCWPWAHCLWSWLPLVTKCSPVLAPGPFSSSVGTYGVSTAGPCPHALPVRWCGQKHQCREGPGEPSLGFLKAVWRGPSGEGQGATEAAGQAGC